MAENCYTGITQAIANECADAVKAGIEERVWILNRADIDTITRDNTYSNLVTGIAMKLTKQAWLLTGTKQSVQAGYSLVVRENAPDGYLHLFDAVVSKNTAAIRKQLDELGDIIVIVEAKNKWAGESGEGTFTMYGFESGLYPTSREQKSNDNYNQHVISFSTKEGQEESETPLVIFDTDYDTTLALVVALETPAS